MKVIIQNLQKRQGLASHLVKTNDPDVLLAQEINLSKEDDAFQKSIAKNVSRQGYGTAIYAKNGELSKIHLVRSPHAEIGGLIHKKTTVATYRDIQFVSFHGYNGQPMKSVSNLKDHVDAVIAVLEKDGPAVFAGDFNTWSTQHLEAVQASLAKAGFQKAFSWPYPGRDIPLDHAFVRGVSLKSASYFGNQSDHNGAILELL